MGNINMHKAKRNKKDEFYTQIGDIEREVIRYKDQFEGKVVYCNCNDDPKLDGIKEGELVNPEGSNFWNFFYLQFDNLGLDKLIATHYNADGSAYKFEYTGGGLGSVVKTKLEGDGDFRSEESIEILKKSDIVCTNPPFSLFREYINQLVEYNKDFLIMGNNNAITYKEVFPLIKDNKVWLGYNANKTMEFRIPDDYDKWDKVDGSGNKYGKVPAISWYTNLDVSKRHEDIILYKEYYGNEEEYPKYDNYDAIEVSRVKDIPRDYEGVMGVPITFLTRYNPYQFKIIALGNSKHNFTPTKEYINPKKVRRDNSVVSGSAINNVLAIEVESKPVGKTYYTSDNSKYLLPPYARVLIKNKNPEIKEGDE